MAIALVGSGSAYAGGAADGFTSGSFDTTGANFIVISFGQGNSVTSGNISADSKGNTWNPLTQQTNSRSCRLFYAWNATTGSGHTFTCTGTDNFCVMSIAWFSGVQSASDPFDVQNGASTGFSSTLATGSTGTPTTDGQVVITGATTSSDGAGQTISSPFNSNVIGTIADTGFGHEGSAMAYEIQTTATARNPTWTHTQAAAMAVTIATFKVDAGPGSFTGTGDISIGVPLIDATGAVPEVIAIGQRIGGIRVV